MRYLHCGLVILFLTCFGHGTQAQCNFHYLYDNDQWYETTLSVLPINDSYVIAGNTFEPGVESGVLFVKLDSCGGIVWMSDSDYSPLGSDQGLDLFQIDSTTLGCVGVHYDSVEGSANSSLYRIDFLTGQIDTFVSINHGWNDWGQEVLIDNEGSLFMTGTFMDSANVNLYGYVAKHDEFGQIIWQSPLIMDSLTWPKKMIFDHDSTLLISGYHRVVANPDDYDMFLAKFDRDGNEVWRRSYGDLSASGGGAVTLANDGGYILTGSSCTVASSCSAYVVKADTQGVVEWEKTIDLSSYSDGLSWVEAHPDGGYVAVGQSFKWYASSSNDLSWVWLCRLNDQGDTLWNRFYNYYGGYIDEIPYDMKITPDGGIVVTGYFLSGQVPTNNDAFVLKVDSMGCEIPGCHVGLEENVEALAVKVYPNPSNGNVFVEVESEAIRNGAIDVYDMMGKQVGSHSLSSNSAVTTLSLNNLADGLYLYQIRSGSKVVTSGKLNIIR